MDLLDRRVAKAAARRVDDALKGEIVRRLRDAAQISERVADFRALVKARAADHTVRQTQRDEALLELAHLERRAHEDRDLFERMLPALRLFDVVADRARFLFRVPHARHGRLDAVIAIGEQRFAKSVGVVRDEA